MPRVPDQPVAAEIEDAVQGQGELDDAQIAALADASEALQRVITALAEGSSPTR